MELNQNEQFIKTAFDKAIVPCMLAMLAININVIVDGVLVSKMIGQEALAAINLSLPLYLALCTVGSFFGYGSSTNAALALGNNKRAEYESFYRTGTTILIIASIILTIFGTLLSHPISALLCSDIYVRPYVYEYVIITMIGVFPKIMIYIPFGYLRLDGRNVEVMIMMATMSIGNIILDILFVYYFNLGVFGAGLASVIATAISCVMGFLWLKDKKSSFKYKFFITKNKYELKRIVYSGTPFALNNLFSTLRMFMINVMLLAVGGSRMIAVFTAINGVISFAECVTLGVPQAGNAILGVFQGEKDYSSSVLLLRRQWQSGVVFLSVFFVLIVGGCDYIAGAYNITENLRVPMVLLAVSLYPSLFNYLLTTYYNISGHNIWANAIIALRLIVMTWISLMISIKLIGNPWYFLPITEFLTIIIWLIAVRVRKILHPNESLYLFIDDRIEKEGKIINFSIYDTNEDICNASEKISDFCGQNGLSPKQTMRISMSIEEILTLVKNENEGKEIHFDLRAYAIDEFIGIRFRYDGKFFNPFNIPEDDPDGKFMGVEMIKNLVAIVYHYRTFGTNTVQVVLDN